MAGASRPSSAADPAISRSGASRFWWMSTASAFRGETYTTCGPGAASCARYRRSMQTRKAARVLPEPVGAAISVSRPAAISAQPRACGGVGPSGNRRRNQVRTAGWKVSTTPATLPSPISPRRSRGSTRQSQGGTFPSPVGPFGRLSRFDQFERMMWGEMLSTMQDFPLTITSLYRRGRDLFGSSEVVSFEGATSRRATFSEVADRAERLAAALQRLGIREGDRVGTLCWNNQEYQEAYLAVPGMGAVLHTLNLRLAPEQLAFIINHAEDRLIIVDGSLVPVLARVADQLKTVEHFIVTGSEDASALPPHEAGFVGTPGLGEVMRYEELLAAEQPGFSWPDLDERSASALCYTTGTTGDPKGVAYSHRSVYLHSLAEWGAFELTERDRMLLIVPMFHVNAWGLPYTAWTIGADLLMPGRFLQPEPLCRFISEERPTFAAGVPTVWNDVLRRVDEHPADLSSLRLVICGGSAVPRSLMEQFQERHGVRIIQAWGMTETSPIGAVAIPPKDVTPDEEMDWRAKTGRVAAGVELRITDDAGDE